MSAPLWPNVTRSSARRRAAWISRLQPATETPAATEGAPFPASDRAWGPREIVGALPRRSFSMFAASRPPSRSKVVRFRSRDSASAFAPAAPA